MTDQRLHLLRSIPQVDALIQTQKGQQLVQQYSQGMLSQVLRGILQQLREELQAGGTDLPSKEQLLTDAETQLKNRLRTKKPVVINATGILLHTNLGRAPLASPAAQAAYEAAVHYSVLEYNLDTGLRGDRQEHVEALVAGLLGAQSALAVNNNAAAVLLMLATLAQGREVVVSRGELVEIGGSFRVPEVMSQSGCLLKEVGTTNKTKLADYQSAINENTGAILKVHTSNYKIMGFTQSVEIEALSIAAKQAGLPLLADLGSGALLPLAPYGLPDEPGPKETLAQGADVVCFSGDKLLGGPQAGILAGKKCFIEAMKLHPLMRALRPDKMTLAALEATLALYQDEQLAKKQIPLYRLLETSVDELYQRGSVLKDALAAYPQAETELIPAQAQLGGGSAPGEMLASIALAVRPLNMSADAFAACLRLGETPVIARIHQGRVRIDLRTVFKDQLEPLASALQAVCLRKGVPNA